MHEFKESIQTKYNYTEIDVKQIPNSIEPLNYMEKYHVYFLQAQFLGKKKNNKPSYGRVNIHLQTCSLITLLHMAN